MRGSSRRAVRNEARARARAGLPGGGRRDPIQGRDRRDASVRPERRPRRLPAWQAGLLVVAVGLMGVLVLTVFPIRSYVAQQAKIADAEAELEELESQNQELSGRAAALQDPAEIERLARSQHGMIRPGEIPFAILPSPEQDDTLPDIWPLTRR